VRGKPASPVLRGGRRSNAPPLPDRTIRPVKVQQRSSGGCWRTIEGLADFAVTQSYLSTAAKWGISKLDALRDLFNGHAWLPPGLEPAA
jgi:transposase